MAIFVRFHKHITSAVKLLCVNIGILTLYVAVSICEFIHHPDSARVTKSQRTMNFNCEEAEGHSYHDRSSHSQVSLSIPNEGGHDTIVYKSKILSSKGFSSLNQMRLKGLLCDVTIRVGNSEFRAHKALLAATVPYFYAMFTSKYS